MTRRDVLRLAVAGAALALAPRTSRAAEGRIDILIDEPIGTISPDLHGHFVEHLGGVVYDGIWVGEGSPVPNIGGIRSALVDALRRLEPGPIRYPGGCFADSYDWRDGTGPRASRPRRLNFWAGASEWGGRAPGGPETYDPNHFGTNEFLRFCRLVGGAPYLAANLRSLTARDFNDWIDYCNAPAGTTALADARARDGSVEPHQVRFWGVGNESWGCGGNFTAEEYAVEYRRFTAWTPAHGARLAFIASGPNGGNLDWTRGFFSKIREKGEGMFGGIYGWALHHYSWNVSQGVTDDWFKGKGDAVAFSIDEYYELLREADRIDDLIRRHWAVMGEYDRQHRTRLVVDEWGTWHRPGTEVARPHLFGQQSTMRDALVAAISLDAFNRHADKVAMANVAQLINCLQALFLAHEDRFLLTPTYHVFDLFRPHRGAQSVRAIVQAPPVAVRRAGKPASFWGLNGSASVRDRRVTLTVTNADAGREREVEIAVRGAAVKAARARVLSAPDVHAHNSFERPRAVEPRDEAVASGAGAIVHRFPPASVTCLTLDLA